MIKRNAIYHALGVLRDAADEDIETLPQQIRAHLKALKTAWLNIPERTRFDRAYRDSYEEFAPEVRERIPTPDAALARFDEEKARGQGQGQQGGGRP